ncbi:hypothetical protein [Streptomyces sp. NPDC019937]|uniref:hypothetical protein n=1 Tax=Streptomyces sp. NPDC019937 TaxID=3154787 RepID=UPI0033F4D564
MTDTTSPAPLCDVHSPTGAQCIKTAGHRQNNEPHVFPVPLTPDREADIRARVAAGLPGHSATRTVLAELDRVRAERDKWAAHLNATAQGAGRLQNQVEQLRAERADRATVLRQAADALDESERLRDLTDDHMRDVHAAAHELRRMADEAQSAAAPAKELPGSSATLAAGMPLVQGRCPACGTAGLFLGSGGYVTCSSPDCQEPDAASTVLERQPVPVADAERRARYEAAFGPNMRLGLQDAELFDEPGAQRINEWITWITDAVMAVADAELGQVRAELNQAQDDRTGACLARWEEEQENARLRLALASARRGRREARARAAELDRALDETIGERDYLHDVADKLAYAIAPVEVIGEHSSANDPWANALEHVAPAARPRVTSHTYEDDGGPCRAEAYGEICGAPRADHQLVEEPAALVEESSGP